MTKKKLQIKDTRSAEKKKIKRARKKEEGKKKKTKKEEKTRGRNENKKLMPSTEIKLSKYDKIIN